MSTANNLLDEPMSKEEERENLRRTLRAKLNASRIDRMSKNARLSEMDKIQKQVQKELGTDYDLGKVMQYMDQQKKNKNMS